MKGSKTTSNVQTPEPSASTPWFDRKRAAQYIGSSIRYIDKLVGERTIPSYKPSRKTLLRQEDLDAWIIKGKQEAL